MLAKFLVPLADRFAGTTALDIGANIGNHSLLFAPRFKAVHCFEPNPHTFGVLSVNAQPTSNFTVHNMALCEEAGTLTLTYNSLNAGEASLVQSYAGTGVRKVDVAVGAVDALAAGLVPVSFIKADVQGFEPKVLRCAKQSLAEQQPVIAFEQNRTASSGRRYQYLKKGP